MCEGKYSGYACIRTHCAIVRESKLCEHHDISGDYCRKYARFGCVGKGNCESAEDYLDSICEDEQTS